MSLDGEYLGRLHRNMELAEESLDPRILRYVRATLEFGVESVRAEYTAPLTRAGKQIRQLLAAVLALIVLGGAGIAFTVAHDASRQRAERRDTIVRACGETNARNRATVHEYDVRIAKVAPHLPRAQRAQLRASRTFTVGLINALAPVQNCVKRASRLTHS